MYSVCRTCVACRSQWFNEVPRCIGSPAQLTVGACDTIPQASILSHGELLRLHITEAVSSHYSLYTDDELDSHNALDDVAIAAAAVELDTRASPDARVGICNGGEEEGTKATDIPMGLLRQVSVECVDTLAGGGGMPARCMLGIDAAPGSPACVFVKKGWDVLLKPAFTMEGPVAVRRRKFRCMTHTEHYNVTCKPSHKECFPGNSAMHPEFVQVSPVRTVESSWGAGAHATPAPVLPGVAVSVMLFLPVLCVSTQLTNVICLWMCANRRERWQPRGSCRRCSCPG